MNFAQEVDRFKTWAVSQDLVGEWEMNYPAWPSFEAATLCFLDEAIYQKWTHEDWKNIVYAVARDNECESFIKVISKNQDFLVAFAHQAVASSEQDAKWQSADYLGEKASLEVAEPILLALVTDEDEYVSRMALLALSKLGFKHTETLVKTAWATGHLYQRIASLHALKNICSNQLEHYIDLAEEDGRTYLLENAQEIRSES